MMQSKRDRFKSLPDVEWLPPYFLTPRTAPGGIHLKKVVFLGYTDMAAAGRYLMFMKHFIFILLFYITVNHILVHFTAYLFWICSRALFGLNMGKEYEAVDIRGLEAVEMVCHRSEPEEATERKLEPVQILHCKYEEVGAMIRPTLNLIWSFMYMCTKFKNGIMCEYHYKMHKTNWFCFF